MLIAHPNDNVIKASSFFPSYPAFDIEMCFKKRGNSFVVDTQHRHLEADLFIELTINPHPIRIWMYNRGLISICPD